MKFGANFALRVAAVIALPIGAAMAQNGPPPVVAQPLPPPAQVAPSQVTPSQVPPDQPPPAQAMPESPPQPAPANLPQPPALPPRMLNLPPVPDAPNSAPDLAVLHQEAERLRAE